MTRRSVVFPEPDGPSSATSSPGRMSSVTSRNAAKAPKSCSTPSTRIAEPRFWASAPFSSRGERVSVTPFEEGFEPEGDKRKARKKDRESECGDIVILIVKY